MLPVLGLEHSYWTDLPIASLFTTTVSRCLTYGFLVLIFLMHFCAVHLQENYFFALSKYQQQLEELIGGDSEFVQPESRKNEVSLVIDSFYTVVHFAI